MAELNLTNTIAHMDIFDLCDCLDDNSIDMILADVPYGEINNNKRLWRRFGRTRF